MAWGIELTTTINVNRVTKSQIEDKIEENNNLIKMFEDELKGYAHSNPRDVVSNESIEHGEVVNEIRIKINEILEGIEEAYRENVLLELMKEDQDKIIEY